MHCCPLVLSLSPTVPAATPTHPTPPHPRAARKRPAIVWEPHTKPEGAEAPAEPAKDTEKDRPKEKQGTPKDAGSGRAAGGSGSGAPAKDAGGSGKGGDKGPSSSGREGSKREHGTSSGRGGKEPDK